MKNESGDKSICCLDVQVVWLSEFEMGGRAKWVASRSEGIFVPKFYSHAGLEQDRGRHRAEQAESRPIAGAGE